MSVAVEPDRPQKLCKSEVVTGSIVPTIICKSAQQWADEARSDDEDQKELVADYAVHRLDSWED